MQILVLGYLDGKEQTYIPNTAVWITMVGLDLPHLPSLTSLIPHQEAFHEEKTQTNLI